VDDEAHAGRLPDHLAAAQLGPPPSSARRTSRSRSSRTWPLCHGRHELEEQLAGEKDEDEPAPGPAQGIRVARADRRW
jgi:hypothetical protein